MTHNDKDSAMPEPQAKHYVIRSLNERDDEGEPLYWSNQSGWVGLTDADVYNAHEQETLNLPMDGRWWPLPTILEREHTATTRHLIDVTTTVHGDEGVDPKYLVDVLMWGLEQHNAAVRRFRGAEAGDHTIEPVAMSASDDIGLGGERAAFMHDAESEMAINCTYFPVEGSSLRRCEDGNNNEPYYDEDILLKF